MPNPDVVMGDEGSHATALGVIETHLSEVFLASDRVFKRLKPVATSFVDFTDRSTRVAAARREYELNRRIAPDVYLGLADVIEGDELADRIIVMRRLPADRQLDRLIDSEDFVDHLRAAARRVAAIHAAEPPITGDAASCADIDALRRNWQDNFDVLAPLAGPLIPADEFATAKDLVSGFLDGRATLFQERIDQGWIRDGHGDLRCEHIFCLDDGPRLIDCLAFSDDFRVCDVLNDVAFLAMDLHRLAGPEASLAFITFYDEFSGENHPPALAHHYVAYRAYVRAKVAAIRFGQGDEEAAAEVGVYHELARQHLQAATPQLVLVGGGAGVGKSTVAEGLSDRFRFGVLRADEIRKGLAGLGADQHAFAEPGQGLYNAEFTSSVYEEMLREAEAMLERAQSVILDASWAVDGYRQAARALAERLSVEVTELCCVAPLPVAKERIARRAASLYNPSDATADVADYIAANFDPWPEATIVDTAGSIAASVAAACAAVGAASAGDHPHQEQRDSFRIEEARLTGQTVEFYLSRITMRQGRSTGR